MISYLCNSIIYKSIQKGKKNKKIKMELMSLDNDCISVIKNFYNKDKHCFKRGIKLLPKTAGIKILEHLEIIEFDDYVDFEGGYSIHVEQFYILKDEYLNYLNKVANSRHNIIMRMIKK